MGSLKFNLSFKKDEAPLYKAAVTDQRAPASFIKDAIEFYLEHLKKEGKTPVAPQATLTKMAQKDTKEEEDSVKTNDILDF